ncbi:MAG: hypothetical protein EXR51_05030 [Dehalococcoidia bacterium]|nr:hypothetical protein [Dehalococcoidia bacterium]
MVARGTRRGRLRRRILVLVLCAIAIPLIGVVTVSGQLRLRGFALDTQTFPWSLVEALPLEQHPWEAADTGWTAIAGDARPKANANFAGNAMTVAGRYFPAGLGVYPTSEIAYRLQGRFRGFAAAAGVDDSTAPGAGATRFMLFGDGVKLYESPVRLRGEPPQEIRVNLAGVDELRLVAVDESHGDPPGLANWLSPLLFRSVSLWELFGATAAAEESRAAAGPAAGALSVEAARSTAALRQARQRELGELEAFASGVFARADVQRNKSGDEQPSAVRGWHDAADQRFMLDNGRTVLTLSTGAAAPGRVSILNRSHQAPHVYQAAPGLEQSPGEPIRLMLATDRGAPPANPFAAIEHPALGRGLTLTQRYRAQRSALTVEVQWSLFEDETYLTFQARIVDPPPQMTNPRFVVFDDREGQVFAGEGLQYLTGYGRPRHIKVRDDGITRRDIAGEGNPVFLWSDQASQSIVLAALEGSSEPARFSIQLPPGRATANLGFSTGRRTGGEGALTSPLVLLDLPASTNPIEALRPFRTVFAALYPALELPSWSRFEWNSWYSYYMDISDKVIARQVDYLAENLKDLGPWHISIDAGWNVAEGHPNADWREVNIEKFPWGIRPVVDYAHAAGVRATLYFSAPYVDTRAKPLNWLGLRGLVEQHPEWLIQVDSDEAGDGYAYDFSHPGFRQYLRDLFFDYLVTHGADGIEVDGLGTAPLALQTPGGRNGNGQAPAVTGQTMEIYRFIRDTVLEIWPGALIYSGWHTPLFANPYSHFFWHSDEFPGFTHTYPFGGLKEHVEYAILQQGMWGQRAHMGFAYGDPNTNVTARWWLEASIALGTHIALGFDLPLMNPATLSMYRERLAHYRPFTGEMFTVGSSYPPEVSGSRRDGFTYLGVMNSRNEPHDYRVPLQEMGLDPSRQYVLLDAEGGRYSLVSGQLTAILPPQSFRFYVLRSEPGVFWSNSSHQESWRSDELMVDVDGPSQISGYVDVIVPRPARVWVDGEELPIVAEEDASELSAVYFDATGILSVRYPHDTPHRIWVTW